MPEFSKKYCCSNALRIESLVATIFDTLLSLIALCAITVFYFFFTKTMISGLNNEDEKENIFGLHDLKQFYELDVQIQELSLLILTTLIILHILMNSILLTGIYKVNSIMVTVWLVCGIVTFIIALALFFAFIYLTKDKIVHSCIFGLYLLFFIYFLWIIRCFRKELVSVSYTTSEEQLQKSTELESSSDSIESKKY